MAQIHILDSETVDMIAAGEVVERPSSVVKELVENAIDAGATAVTVEVRDGGIEFIRVTDNGCGMAGEQLRTAFLRHATSKIENAGDLTRISSLGFRGEALSSIAAVAKVEVITKTADSITGSRILLEGGREIGLDEVGAPDGTTFLVRNLFFNTPVRRKFLRQPATEGGYIVDLMEHLALSRPDISFRLMVGNQMKFHTSGNGDLREVIYRIYGRNTAGALAPIQAEQDGIRIEGYLGTPVQVRSNRNHEIYFINGRYIRSNIIARALEEGYKEYLMQHKFPFCVLHISMDTEEVDVNVHPTKMDVRFHNAMGFSAFLCGAVKYTLLHKEMIPEAVLETRREQLAAQREERRQRESERTPEPFEQRRSGAYQVREETKYRAEHPEMKEFIQNPLWGKEKEAVKPIKMTDKTSNGSEKSLSEVFFTETNEEPDKEPAGVSRSGMLQDSGTPVQLNLFEERILSAESRRKYRLIGQVFETYWLIEYEDRMLMIDQHAAHEKVNYERLMKQYREKNVVSQTLMPPVIVSLSGQEEVSLRENAAVFASLGFEIESFGGSEYALRGVPADLYGCDERGLFLEVLDQLAEGKNFGGIRVVEEKIASMSCKAAVKGNNLLHPAEAEALIDELLTLENPYNCPHGRPTVIVMTKAEMDRKFKRIVE
ncbi:MAG: DNA mismatch repair endonuclease MutL [Roseburia sp.]|nr:DNA mismatch repair endonuclease MutL [Roseburia sp.]MCM1098062.1 DNA mismatch repair endonuclease MutL [Ruminococcus flavefaciens]